MPMSQKTALLGKPIECKETDEDAPVPKIPMNAEKRTEIEKKKYHIAFAQIGIDFEPVIITPDLSRRQKTQSTVHKKIRST